MLCGFENKCQTKQYVFAILKGIICEFTLNYNNLCYTICSTQSFLSIIVHHSHSTEESKEKREYSGTDII